MRRSAVFHSNEINEVRVKKGKKYPQKNENVKYKAIIIGWLIHEKSVNIE